MDFEENYDRDDQKGTDLISMRSLLFFLQFKMAREREFRADTEVS